jgi:hypothetical protein
VNIANEKKMAKASETGKLPFCGKEAESGSLALQLYSSTYKKRVEDKADIGNNWTGELELER